MGECSTTPGLDYKVEDRSLMMPMYRRLFVTPFLRFIPARVHPNSITHAGHVINLIGMLALVTAWPRPGWPYFAAAIGVQIYNWCDNADGQHARRTGQCSAMGEFLDHGLDTLNVAYIAFISALAIGATGVWAMALTLVVPMAASTTCWEQAETGVFRLGRLNQIEALVCLSAVLVVSGVFGIEVWDRFTIGPFTGRVLVMAFCSSVPAFGIAHGIWRVWRARGIARVMPIVPLVLFNVTVAIVTAVGAGSVVAAVIIGTAGNVFFGLRMLSLRLHGERPRTEYWLGTFTMALFALIAWRMRGQPVGFASDAWFATLSGIVFGGLALVHARQGVKRVMVLDQGQASR